ncbi:DUF1015 domain-containing protein [Endothiovibrio diazotrophicus]
MTLIRPFAGLRPAPGRAAEVAAPPYDVINFREAVAKAEGRPNSFLHVSRAEIDLPEGTNPYEPQVYAKSRENYDRMVREGVLVRDEQPYYYVYRLIMGDHEQTGLVAAASVADYDTNRIRKHEFTRPAKESDRVSQVDALDAQTGPVLLTYRAHDEVARILAEASAGEPDSDVTAEDGVRHTVWVIRDGAVNARITGIFDAFDALYIADGHHRSAAASRVCARRKAANRDHSGEEAYNYFLVVMFPHDQMRILDYNRAVNSFNGMEEEEFLVRIEEAFTVEARTRQAKPSQPGEFGMYLPGGRWYLLTIKPELIPADDPVARLDVSLLQDNLLAPLLGIEDPRQDNRIDFIGGIRGLRELEIRVESGDMEVAFACFPTRMEDLMAVADANEVMPPKSTWFEPKLADGLVSHVLD